MTAMSRGKLNLKDGWYDSDVFPQGWIIKMLVAGETPNIFLLNEISHINFFFIKKKNIVVDFKSNTYDKFA